jgi:lysophospholipase L1-like esterase
MNRRTFLQVASASALAPLVRATPRLVCFGDSITVGQGASTPEHTYAAIVARTLGYTLDNRAIGATRIADQLAREILITRVRPPDVALFLSGYNDMRHATPLADYQQMLAQAVAWLTQDGAALLLGDCVRGAQAGYGRYAPFDQGSDAAVVAFNQVIHGFAYVAASAAFDPINSSADLAHPNDRGHAQIASAFLHRQYVPIMT